jgi:protein gp37
MIWAELRTVMAQSSTIEWTDATWNPVLGCTEVSDGCKNCYAERMSNRLAGMARGARARGQNAGRKANYVRVIGPSGRWNRKVFLDESALDIPHRWRLPRTVFVNSMSDLYHQDVPTEFIRRVFTTMNDCPQHVFQLLTKRPERAADLRDAVTWTGNIWIGTSVENANVTSRVRALQRIRAARVRFLSVEPLLGPIPRLPLQLIDWVIVGGESGPGARAMHQEWVRQIRERCRRYDVPFFFKQWGGVNKKRTGRILDGKTWDEMPSASEDTRLDRHLADALGS